MKNINNRRGALLILACAIGGCEYALDNQDLLRRGETALRAGQYRAAAVDLKNVVKHGGDDGVTRTLLAEALLGAGDPAAALAEAEKARELGQPDASTALVRARALLALDRPAEALEAAAASTAQQERSAVNTVRGDAALRLERLAEARTFYEAALSADARNSSAWAGLALASEDASSATEVLERGARAAGDAAALRLARGTIQNREGQFQAAAGTFRTLLDEAAKSGDSRLTIAATLGLVEAEIGLGRNQEAYDRAAELLSRMPHSLAARGLAARAAFVLGRYEEAREQLQQLLAHYPDRAAARLLLGAVNYAERNFAQAEMYLSSVIASEPGNAFARRLLAETRLREQQPEHALATLLEGDLHGPNRALAARINLRSGNVEAGLALLEEGAASNPGDRAAQLELAAAYMSTGRYVPALRALEALPPNVGAPDQRDYLLMFAAARLRDDARAIRLAHELIAKYPDESSLSVVAATFEVLTGQRAEARRTLSAALARKPRDPALLLALARLELQEGSLDAATANAKQALLNRAKLAPAALTLAEISAARNDEAAARRWLEHAAEWAPASAMPRALLARYHLSRGEFPEAHELAQAAAKLAPDDALVLDLLSQTAGRVGRGVEALAAVKASAERARGSAAHQLALARASIAAGRTADALTAARAAVAIEPQDLQANVLLATLLVQTDRAAAAEVIAKLRRAHGDHAAVLALDGDLAGRDKRFGEAAAAYRLASERLPQREAAARMRLLAAQASLQAGDERTAAADFERVLAGDPDNAIALNNLAWLYHERQDHERALKLAERAYTLKPKTPAIIDTYAWILVQRGEFGRGIRLLEEALALGSDDPAIRQHLAQARMLGRSSRGAGG